MVVTDDRSRKPRSAAAERSEPELIRGLPVRRAQSILSRHGFATPIDGTYGPDTEAAVKVLQEKHGLPVDGKLGKNTWAAINSLDPAES